MSVATDYLFTKNKPTNQPVTIISFVLMPRSLTASMNGQEMMMVMESEKFMSIPLKGCGQM
jgi:hypothetical protein